MLKKPAIFCVMLVLLATICLAANISLFNNSLSQITLTFSQNRSNSSFYLSIPNGTVTKARMSINGTNYFGAVLNYADVVIVTDVSGSMAGQKIIDAKAADTAFVNTVDLEFVHVGLVHFSGWSTTALDVHLTDNKNVLLNMISTYMPLDSTNMGEGMNLSVKELNGPYAQGTPRKYMLVMTDGLPNCRPIPTACGDSVANIAGAKEFVNKTSQRANDSGIIIFSIGFGSDADMNLISLVANNTGGKYYYAPDQATLLQIYKDIAESISDTSFPSPIISSSSPIKEFGWKHDTEYTTFTTWDNNDCGGAGSTCIDFRKILQDNMNACVLNPCKIIFKANSTTIGQITLSNLFIDFNEAPVSNYNATIDAPEGTCLEKKIVCGESESIINIDDGSMVIDDNDPSETLSWKEQSSQESPDSYINSNADFNQTRVLNFSIDENFINSNYWKLFVYNVSDPWGSSTTACINITYEGCAPTGEITCKDDLSFLLHTGNNYRSVLFTDIFNFGGETGNVSGFKSNSIPGLEVREDFPNRIEFRTAGGFNAKGILKLSINTTYGINSSECSLEMININSKCDNQACDVCFGLAPDYACLKANLCLDKRVEVYSPYRTLRMSDIMTLPDVVSGINSFESLNSPFFQITPGSGNKNQIFSISGPNLANNVTGAAVAKLAIGNDTVRICPQLHKINFTIGETLFEPDTNFLVGTSKAIIGHYDVDGNFIITGPYIFTSRVWLRK